MGFVKNLFVGKCVISLSAVCIKLSRYEDWPFPVDGIGCFYKGKQR